MPFIRLTEIACWNDPEYVPHTLDVRVSEIVNIFGTDDPNATFAPTSVEIRGRRRGFFVRETPSQIMEMINTHA